MGLTNRLSLDSTWQGSMACLPCVTVTLWVAASFSTLLYGTYQHIITGLYLTGKYGLFILCYWYIMSSIILFYTIVWDSTWQGSMACLPCVTVTLWAAASFSTLLYGTYQQIIIGLYLTGKYGLFTLCYCHIMSKIILSLSWVCTYHCKL